MATDLDPFFYAHPADNIAPLATLSVETGTADSAYPAANAVDLTPAKIGAPAKILETSGAWEGDFGSALQVDLVVLWSNADETPGSPSSPATEARWQQNSAASWGSPIVDEPFTIPARRADGYARKPFLDLRNISGSAPLRYFRVVFENQTDPVAMKVLCFTRIRQLTRDLRWGVQDDEHQTNITMNTDGAVKWGYDLAAAPRSQRGAAILSDADAEAVREWFRACAGTVSPTLIIPEPTGNDAWIVYWSPQGFSIQSPTLLVAGQTNQRDFPDANQTLLSFEEVAIGDPEWF